MDVRSKIILGTVQFGLKYGVNNQNGQTSEEEVFNIFDYARDNGISILDTANAYGNSEEIIGRYIAKQKTNPFKIASKFNTSGNVPEIVDKTLNRLNCKQLFGFSFHNFDFFKSSSSEVIEELKQLKAKSVIENIGISVYSNEQLRESIALDWIDMIQLPYNLLDRDKEKEELLAKAKDSGKIVHVRSVFLQGLFQMSPDSLPLKLHPLKDQIRQIQNIAHNAKISVSSLALNYVIQKKFIDNLLIGVETLQQLKDNLDSIENLDSSLIKQIDSISVSNPELLNPVNWN